MESASDWVRANEMIEKEKFHSDRWRPTLGMIVTAMLIFILLLPLGSIWIFRFYDSQLVRDTENELIAQGAFVKAMFRKELDDLAFDASGLSTKIPKPEITQKKELGWIEPQLDLARNPILSSRPDAVESATVTSFAMKDAGAQLTKVIGEAQRVTLAGFRVLDPNGIVIAGGNEIGMSLAHIPEVKQALLGSYASVIRERISENARPPIYSISRGTDIRVFVAMPVDYKDKVAGVVYLSRTPSHFLMELYGQRWNLAGALIFLVFVTLAVAVIFVRTIKGPIDALNDRTRRISQGDRSAISPLPRHGTREIADLSQGLLSMSQQLQSRADYIRNFANHVSHELKSPITSVRGAAELLKDTSKSINDENRQKFLNNILGDAERMTSLLERLRELAAAENLVSDSSTYLPSVLADIDEDYPGISVTFGEVPEVCVALSNESMNIALGNIVENAINHGASKISVTAYIEGNCAVINLHDNGSGISEANREKIFDLFFTTRRDQGGTGMGLNIVRSSVESLGGELELVDSEKGAHFKLTLPISAQHAN